MPLALDRARTGTEYTISVIALPGGMQGERSVSTVARLTELGIFQGQKITLLGRSIPGGSFLVWASGGRVALSRDVAALITIR